MKLNIFSLPFLASNWSVQCGNQTLAAILPKPTCGGILSLFGIDHNFIQDNESSSRALGTVRGLHFQVPPFAQTKLVRVLSGRILDVVVDLRRSSPTYGKHLAIELNEALADQLLIPTGFAHGFCTLEPGTVVFYKVDNVYSPITTEAFTGPMKS